MQAFMNFLDIAVPILGGAFVFLSVYHKTKGNLIMCIAELIATAEASGLTGPEKMAQVVAALYVKVPKALKKHLTEKHLEMLAQWTFDRMRKYALLYMDAQKDAALDESKVEEQMDQIGATALAELLAELLDLADDALVNKAHDYGINAEDMQTREDVIKAIILTVLKKA